MATNNSITLIGNMGAEARIIETDNTTFAAVSLATTDSYKDDNGYWHDNETIWHNLVTFNPKVIKEFAAFKKGSRLKVTGSLSYRPFDTNMITDDGVIITKKEASIIVREVVQDVLVKKPVKATDEPAK